MEEEFDAVYNYLTRNQYPDGLTKDEKRNFCRKVYTAKMAVLNQPATWLQARADPQSAC